MSNWIGKEDDFQVAAIKLLRAMASVNGIDTKAVVHIPNGGHRNIATAARLKRMGVVAGYPDVMVFSNPGLALELKVRPNGPRSSQLVIHEILKDAGWQVAVCYGMDDVERSFVQHVRRIRSDPA